MVIVKCVKIIVIKNHKNVIIVNLNVNMKSKKFVLNNKIIGYVTKQSNFYNNYNVKYVKLIMIFKYY